MRVYVTYDYVHYQDAELTNIQPTQGVENELTTKLQLYDTKYHTIVQRHEIDNIRVIDNYAKYLKKYHKKNNHNFVKYDHEDMRKSLELIAKEIKDNLKVPTHKIQPPENKIEKVHKRSERPSAYKLVRATLPLHQDEVSLKIPDALPVDEEKRQQHVQQKQQEIDKLKGQENKEDFW